MAYQKATLMFVAVIGVIIAASSLALALLSTSLTMPNTGTVNVPTAELGVYWDAGFSQEVSAIEWGVLSPGQSKQVTVYVRNEGNVDLVLSMATSNWSPSIASSYITLNWNRQGYTLNSGSHVQAVFTLTVSSDVAGVESFSFDITISGAESA